MAEVSFNIQIMPCLHAEHKANIGSRYTRSSSERSVLTLFLGKMHAKQGVRVQITPSGYYN